MYHRLPRLIDDIQLSRGDGRYIKLLKSLARIDVLVLDDWGLARLTPPQQRDLLELLDDRHTRKSTIVTSQLPIDHWDEAMADPTVADASLDRLMHNAHHISLKGESMRKQLSDLNHSGHLTTSFGQRRSAPTGGRHQPFWVADFNRSGRPTSPEYALE